jgi:uncharacterized membrane protein
MPARTLTILRRRTALCAAAAALAAGALLAPSTSAHQTLVHAYTAKDGTTVVSGYDGGAPLKP